MDPNGNQFSINDPFKDNALHCPGFTLPRSFTHAGHGRTSYGVFSILSIAPSPGKSFTRSSHERQAYGDPFDLSINHFRTPILDLFSLTSVWGNSRALVQSIIRGNQTRILFVLFFAWEAFWILLQCVKSGLNLNVPYTVIRAHSAMGVTFAPISDYLKDLYS